MIRMKGDAMSPKFNDGDLLVEDTDDKMPGDGIYIVCDGQGFVVRRVQYIPGSNWTPTGAVQAASGYEVAWKVTGADQYTIWNTDSNGA